MLLKQGGLKGQGMGEGILKDSVPEAHTDYLLGTASPKSMVSVVSASLIISIFLLLLLLGLLKNCVLKDDEFLNFSL